MHVIEALIPIVAILAVFGFLPLTVLGGKYLKLLEARQRTLGNDERARLEAVQRENAQLRGRVENLETIVTSVETDVNRRIERLFVETQQSLGRMAALEGLSLSRQLTGFIEPLPDLGSRYRVIEEIGRGGMGTVYKAQDLKLNETVALKLLPSHIALDHKAVERFCHEASASRKITHPNVIRIHDIGEEKSRVYISMEYFPAESLKQLLRREGPLPVGRALEIGRQIVDGLSAAHAQGVIHRDMKPHNVLVGKNDLCKLIDFGLARSNLMYGLTATGTIMGTPEYMSPEQVRGEQVGEAGDLYSFGVLVYEMLAGRVPFTGESPIAVGYKHLNDEPPPLEERAGPLPPALIELVRRLMRKHPAERFESAKDVASAWADLRR
jgi:eukaryotic-like serine/threonine-protein kinase